MVVALFYRDISKPEEMTLNRDMKEMRKAAI